MFADSNARCVCQDAAEFSTNGSGRIGFGIETFVLSETARKENVNHRFGSLFGWLRSHCTQAGHMVTAKAEKLIEPI